MKGSWIPGSSTSVWDYVYADHVYARVFVRTSAATGSKRYDPVLLDAVGHLSPEDGLEAAKKSAVLALERHLKLMAVLL